MSDFTDEREIDQALEAQAEAKWQAKQAEEQEHSKLAAKSWELYRTELLKLVGKEKAIEPHVEECQHKGPRKTTVECECGLELDAWWEA